MAVFQGHWKLPFIGKAMHKTFAVLFSVLLLAACGVPPSIPGSLTAPANSQNCAYVWNTQPLPDLTEKVQSAIDAAGLSDVKANAQAYGEDCIDPQTNKPSGFATMETDFRITAQVADITDFDNMGGLLEKVLFVLDAFPLGKIPGPQPGYINISFQSGKSELNLSFTAAAGKSARQQGLHGAALVEKLQKK
jgi:hypothetical protein